MTDDVGGPLRIGDPVPDPPLRRPDGTEARLSDHRGRLLLVQMLRYYG